METQELNSKVQQTLDAFANANVSLDNNWNATLLQKLNAKNRHSNNSLVSSKLALGIVLLIAINSLFVYETMIKSSEKYLSRNEKLKAIQHELMINENLSNN